MKANANSHIRLVRKAVRIGRCERNNKFQYPSFDEASLAAKETRKAIGAKVKPYSCRYCSFWHVGHDRPPERRKQSATKSDNISS